VPTVERLLSETQAQKLSDFVDTSSFGVRRRLPEDQIQRISQYLKISPEEVRSLLAVNDSVKPDRSICESDLEEIEKKIEAINDRLDLLSRVFPE